MPGRALLIGAALDGLGGVENDVEAMETALKTHGFVIEHCVGADATRAGILAAYEKLIEEAEPGQPAVVYYSGHGGQVLPPDTGVPGPELMDMQFIAPLDFHDSSPGDFRGITSVELSVLLARLTLKTANATVILDCCHAARMSRDSGLHRVKAVLRPAPYDMLRQHIDRLRDAGTLRTQLLRSTGNPNAVRIVACAPEQSAFEYDGEKGRRIGVLTESLTMALAEAGSERVTWASVMDRVRRRVVELSPGQRPEAEGPSHRILFDTTEEDLLTTLPVTDVGNGRVRLECAPLLGVQSGDTFLITRPGTTASDTDAKVGDLRIDRISPLYAEGPVVFAETGIEPESGMGSGTGTRMPIGARAHRVTVGAPTIPVLLPDRDPRDPRTEDLGKAVEAAAMLRPAAPNEHWLAAVRIDASGGMTVEDRIGPLHTPRAADPGGMTRGMTRVINDLNTLARASALRGLVVQRAEGLGAAVAVEWGLVQGGTRRPQPDSGAVVRVGELLYVSARNNDAREVFVSLLDIGVSGRVTVLTRFAPSGVRLDPGHEYAFGYDDFNGVLAGVSATWPDGLDARQPRPETILALVTSDPQDLSALEQDGVSRGRQPRSPLEAILEQVANGRTRDLPAAGGPTARYDLYSFDFDLDPVVGEGPFLVDERPDPSTTARIPRGSSASAATVAVRVEELVIHHNRALFGADVRVDAIVTTGPTATGQPGYSARTERFSHIRDGEPLPLDRMLVYHGPVADYLDFALWVSRDSAGSMGLGEMLTDELAGFEMQDALAKMGSAVAAVPYVAATVAAASLGVVVVNLAYKLLRGAVPDVIGLYRGSMLAQERFGEGRHPAAGTRRIQDFSLAYRIEYVD